MMWDAVDKKAKTFDSEFKDALYGHYEVNGTQCRPAFDLVNEEFAQYTPEWAERSAPFRLRLSGGLPRNL